MLKTLNRSSGETHLIRRTSDSDLAVLSFHILNPKLFVYTYNSLFTYIHVFALITILGIFCSTFVTIRITFHKFGGMTNG
ncbi:hypothetical protein SUGI_0685710 [Cryptomeria japonica]|nr:hypothetical protein SUGI_0685710 [Cryptomeria japonica]